MYRSLPIAILILLSLAVPGLVFGQCCDVPNGDPYNDNMITWNGVDIIDDNVTYNGTLFVEGHMRIIDSDVIFEGNGLVLNSTGTLEVVNSTISSDSIEHGYYLDLKGDTTFDNVTLEGCFDMENGYFGLYVENGLLQGNDLIMKRSGMIRLDGGDIDLVDSVINGIMSYSGNMTMDDTLIELTGVTQYGPGTVDLNDVIVTSNMSFSQTAGISSLQDGEMILDNVTVTGSFNAGVSLVSSSLWMNDTRIDLMGGIFGIRGTDSEVIRSENIMVSGTGTGMELYNCTMATPLTHSYFDTTFLGLSFNGNNPVEVISTTLMNSTYGMTSSAPLEMMNVTLIGNEVGLLVEGGSIVEMGNCRFEDFGQWAIEDESWDQRTYEGNEFIPSNTSIGTVAWWGWTTIEIYGPDMIQVLGAEVILESSLGSRFQVQGSEVGAIWGYLDLDDNNNMVNYKLEAKWGTAAAQLNFTPSKNQVVEVYLPLTDLIIEDIDYEDSSALVTIQCNGSEAKEVEIDVYVDGRYRNTYRTTIDGGEEKVVSIELSKIDPGNHDMSAIVRSNSEYSGMDGYLQENNEISVQIEVQREKDNGTTNLFLFGLVILTIIAIITIIFLQKKD